MATTKKTTKATSTKKVSTIIEEPVSSTVRIVLDVPATSMERFRVLCNLVGDTQSNMVTKAMDSYVSDRKDLIDQFIELRTKIDK